MKNDNTLTMLNSIVEEEDIKKTELDLIDMDDDMAVLYTAIYSHPELAVMLNDNLCYISDDQMGNALYYAAMGNKESLMELISASREDGKQRS